MFHGLRKAFWKKWIWKKKMGTTKEQSPEIQHRALYPSGNRLGRGGKTHTREKRPEEIKFRQDESLKEVTEVQPERMCSWC